jgi:hypothetical protein
MGERRMIVPDLAIHENDPQGGRPSKRPQDLPHGLLTPPAPVAAIVAREEAKFPPEIFTPEARVRLTADLTL